VGLDILLAVLIETRILSPRGRDCYAFVDGFLIDSLNDVLPRAAIDNSRLHDEVIRLDHPLVVKVDVLNVALS